VKSSFALRKKALEDVKEIWEWVADHYGEPRADRLVAAIYDDCLMLARMPGIGHRRPDLTRRNSLFWTSGPYHIIYVPETIPLEIDRIIHISRDVKKALS
jgi:plasmid stabilization system protein ParE